MPGARVVARQGLTPPKALREEAEVLRKIPTRNTHRLWAALFAVISVALSSLAIVPAATAADTPGCVTRNEFYSVHKGMRMSRVHNIWDTRGRVTARDVGVQDRAYRICHAGQGVYAEYAIRNGVWRLQLKWANAQ